jgi:hypothetical protein
MDCQVAVAWRGRKEKARSETQRSSKRQERPGDRQRPQAGTRCLVGMRLGPTEVMHLTARPPDLAPLSRTASCMCRPFIPFQIPARHVGLHAYTQRSGAGSRQQAAGAAGGLNSYRRRLKDGCLCEAAVER